MTYMLICLYALLTGIAGLQEWKGKGFHVRYLLFIVISIMMLLTVFFQNKDSVLILLLVEFAVLHVLAVVEGLITNGKLNYGHHIIRFIIHCILLIMVYKFVI